MLVDDGSSSVSLPELPLLAVLPGTGGLTRVTDKRKCAATMPMCSAPRKKACAAKRAVEWRLVDEVVPNTKLEDAVKQRAQDFAKKSDRPSGLKGIALTALQRKFSDKGIDYSTLSVTYDRAGRTATITIRGPETPPPTTPTQCRRRAPTSGRCGWRANSTTPFSISAPTSSNSP
jgi:benzoyl-CoA-dihydrodiol lyase